MILMVINALFLYLKAPNFSFEGLLDGISMLWFLKNQNTSKYYILLQHLSFLTHSLKQNGEWNNSKSAGFIWI